MMNKSFGASLLIAGCCIGAGMLGVPVMTGPGGFMPSCLFLVLVAAFMITSGLILLECVLSFEKENINLVTMAEATLGKRGKTVVSILFLSLFYAIMTAYIIGGSRIFIDFSKEFFSLDISFPVASIFFTLLMYFVITKTTAFVDLWNRMLMFGLIATYILLVIYGFPFVERMRLERYDWSLAVFAVPILVISFGFHNLVPTLVQYLSGKKQALVKAIIFGCSIPLLVYILWNLVIIGIVPYEEVPWEKALGHGEIVTQVLVKAVNSTTVVDISQGFAFFAILTSFIPVAFSFLDVLHDATSNLQRKIGRKKLAVGVLLPPFLIALIDPRLFLVALNIAGGFCAVTLFGIVPALMALKRRKARKEFFTIGKTPVLLLIIVVSCTVIAIELYHELSKL